MIPGLCSLVYPGRAFGGMTVTAYPGFLGAFDETTVGPTTATPIGGTPPYTYLWVYFAGDVNIVPDAPTSATTNFLSPPLLPGDGTASFYYCAVTDSASNTANSNQVNIYFNA